MWLKQGLDRIGRMQALAEGGGDEPGVSAVAGAGPKPHHTHPTVPLSAPFCPFLPLSFSPSLSVSLYLSPLLLFSFQNALLTKRFTNPGWYIIHDRLLWDWFKQMDSEREGGMERRRREGGLHGKDGKSEKRCVPAAALQNHHMGRVEYSSFLLHFEKPYIKRSLYSLYVPEEAWSLWGQSGAGCTMISLCICMHGASLEADMISSWPRDWTFIKGREGVSIARLIFTLWIRLRVMFNKVDFSGAAGFSPEIGEGEFDESKRHWGVSVNCYMFLKEEHNESKAVQW